MAGNTFGTIFTVTTFGESHGVALGCIVDGCPAGIPLTEADVQAELDRRRPGQSAITTPRNESDTVQILSGVFDGVTTGTPISMVVFNADQKSRDYDGVKDLFRPGHADFAYHAKYGVRDYRGGGRSSSRETIGRVAAGAVAKKALALYGVSITGSVIQVGDIVAEKRDFSVIEKNPVRCPDMDAAKKMEELILKVKDEGDSVGGVSELVIAGLPVGIGEPVFERLNAKLAYAMMSIPAVKGVEFGAGFAVATRRGSENNDEILPDGFASNNAGGTLGGISTGQDVVLRFAVKPASSILIEKRTVDRFGNPTTAVTEGRHDPCVAPRVVPIAESMAAMTVLDLLLMDRSKKDFGKS